MDDNKRGVMRISVLMTWLYLCFGMLLLNHAHAETATATADDALVIGNILKQQTQAQNPSQNRQATQPQSPQAQPSSAPRPVDDGTQPLQVGIPDLNQPIIDQTHILSAADHQELSDRIRAIHQAGKAQIGVVIVPTTGQEVIFDYAMRIANQWQLGSAKQDNGLLMVIAVNDHKIQILTGYGLEGVLPDVVTHRIIQNQITPYFKQNQYAQGIAAGIQQIETVLNQDPEIARQAADSLKAQQAQAHQEQSAQGGLLMTGLIIAAIAVFASMIVGRKLAAFGAGVGGVAMGLMSGAGLFGSLLLGGALFFLIISSIAQLFLQMFAMGGGRGGFGGSGGFGGGGGYSGGGGGFGGGGASGSW